MTEIIKSISVDVALKNTFAAVVAKQGDRVTRYLKVQLLNEGTKITVNPEAVVTINALRSDKLSNAFSGKVNDDGTVTVPLAYWMLEKDGTTSCSISVFENDGRLTSTSFSILVEHAEYLGEDIAEDEDYGLLLSLLSEVSEYKAAELQRVAAENERVLAENARIEAETARETAESERETAEQNRVAAWANAAGIQQILITDENDGKKYGYQYIVKDGHLGIEITEINN